MRQVFYCRSLVIASSLAVSMASAQTTTQDNSLANKVEETPPPTLNRFGLNYRMGFNITAKFRNLGGFPALNNPMLTPDGSPWNYDNGYVLEDIQGNNSSLTWNWGYSGPRAAQISSDGQFLLLSRSSSSGAGNSFSRQDDPQEPGLELTYNREFGRIGQAGWGLEGAFNYLSVSIRDNSTLHGDVTRQTDAYAFPADPTSPTGFVDPPNPPYFGNFQGPVPGGPNRPVISQNPTPGQGSLTTIPNGATIAGQRKITADVYGFRFGPYAQFPIHEKWSLSLSAGLALASVNSQFKFNETVTIPGVGAMSRSGSASHSDLLVGGYAAGSFSYAFSRAWSASAGVQYQILGSSVSQAGGKVAELDLRNSLFVTFGIGYSF